MKGRLTLLLLRLLSWLPLPANHAVGALIGRLTARFDGRTVAIVRTNLALCLPELNDTAREALVRRALEESGKTLSEMGAMWHWSAERLLGLVREVENSDAVEAAMAEGRGVVMMTPHHGSWEIAGLYCASRWPMTILYRPPREEALEPLIREGRMRTGGTLAKTDAAGVKALIQGLKRGEMLGILPDQEPGEGNGVFAPFLGVAAYTMVLVPRLAAKAGAPVFIAESERLPKGRGYRLRFIRCPDAIASKEPVAGATALNQAVAEVVRRNPEQYQWGYKRFKRRPAGEPSVY